MEGGLGRRWGMTQWESHENMKVTQVYQHTGGQSKCYRQVERVKVCSLEHLRLGEALGIKPKGSSSAASVT